MARTDCSKKRNKRGTKVTHITMESATIFQTPSHMVQQMNTCKTSSSITSLIKNKQLLYSASYKNELHSAYLSSLLFLLCYFPDVIAMMSGNDGRDNRARWQKVGEGYFMDLLFPFPRVKLFKCAADARFEVNHLQIKIHVVFGLKFCFCLFKNVLVYFTEKNCLFFHWETKCW